MDQVMLLRLQEQTDRMIHLFLTVLESDLH